MEENGYKFEEYNITTKDGYILTMHRILPANKNLSKGSGEKAPPVLVQHGIEDSSFMWVQNTPSKAPAFVLANAGFDVWLGNNRGNEYGMNHVKYTTDQEEFWDFDFEDMGLHDVPAFVDFILEKTKDTNPIDKLAAYIGHSEGTTQFFIGSSMIPDYYEEKINMFVAFAPVARVGQGNPLFNLGG